ncbi:MAG: SulP family inorganic anion transporter [Deltaproteobacteria bacterium]|nr:MAG: SulP family inorganic anion transporter [Deltaproteobacteria bacterium]
MHVQLTDFFPCLAWLKSYDRRHLRGDLIAGLTVAVVAVPQSMAYALIAGLPVQYGLYASIVPAIIGSLWGSSAQLITGPTTAISLVVFSTLTKLATPGSVNYLELAFMLALMVGVVQVVMGLARLGSLLNFISHSVILGFTAGAAVLIAFKQVPHLLGLRLEKSSVFLDSLLQIVYHLHETQPITVILGLITIAVILVVKKLYPFWPGTLIAVLVAGASVALFGLNAKGVAVVGTLPRSLPPLHLPRFSGGVEIASLAPGALAIAILGLMEAVSIAKAIAGHTHQRLNVNQEFIGQGLANLGAALFSGYAASGSFTRSAVNFRSGGLTPMSGVLSAVTVAAVILLAAHLASKLPVAALAGVLMVVAYDMVAIEDIKRAIRATRGDGAVLVVTFLSTLFLHLEFAIYIGVLLSIGLHLAETAHPRMHSVVPDLKTGTMVGSAHGPICCQMDIVTIEGSVFFGSATYVLEDFQRRLKNHPDVANLLIRMHQANILDASGIHALEVLLDEVRIRGGGLYFAGIKPRVFRVFKNSGLLTEVGENHFLITTGSAIRQAMRESFCPAICAACKYIVFVECPELKRGSWEILGTGVRPPGCTVPKQAEET